MAWSDNANWVAIWGYAKHTPANGYGNFGLSVRLVFDPFNK